MSRPKFEPTEYMNELLNELCKLKGVSRTQMNREFISTLEALIKAGSLDFGYGILFKRARENVSGGVNVSDVADFDVKLLETAKCKSGFAGVYTQGSRWRAQVPDPDRGGIPKQLPFRDTPIEAAIDRYRWFDEHLLPYGNLALHVEFWKVRSPTSSFEEVIDQLIYDAERNVPLKWPLDLDELIRFRDRWLQKHPRTEAPTKVEEPPAEVLCGICSKPIEDSYDMRIYKDVWRHRRCREPVTEN